MSEGELYNLIHKIRAQRRLRLTPKKKTAKSKRAPNKKNLRPQDMFAMMKGMTSDTKAKMAKQLLESMKK